MSFNRYDQKFPAVLKSIDDKVLEVGTASISPENRSLDFKSEFVPICKMGTLLKIVRTKNDLEVQSFIGEVYLSSQRMLRIVSVTDEVLPGAGHAFLYNTALEGWASASVQESQPGHFGLLRKRPFFKSARVFLVNIHAISLAQVKFTCDTVLEEGQQLTLSVKQVPVLEKVPLVVEQAVTFGEDGHNSYRCRFLEMEGANLARLEPVVEELSLRTNKLFPPVFTPDDEEDP